MPITVQGSTLIDTTTSPPPTTVTLQGAGTSSYTGVTGFPASLTDYENRVGHISIRRLYDRGQGTAFGSPTGGTGDSASSALLDVGKRVTWYSTKPDMVALSTGSGTAYNNEIAKINSVLDSCPTTHKVIWCWWHEPENNFTTATTQAQYRSSYANLCTTVKSRNNPNWKTSLIKTAFSWQSSVYAAQGMDNYWPGDDFVDIVGVDNYNEGSLSSAQRWDSFGRGNGAAATGETGYSFTSQGGCLQWAFDHGKPVAYGEWGTIRNHNAGTPAWCNNLGIASTKDAWIKHAMKFMDDNNHNLGTRPYIMGSTYFSVAGRTWAGDNTETWQLWQGTPGADSWGGMQTAMNLYGQPTQTAEPAWPI